MSADALGATAGEREMLTGFLDWYRAVVARKVEGLGLESASRAMTPTGLSPLGILKHLAYAERGWFELRFAGEDVAVPRDEDGGNTVQFGVGPDDTVESVLAFYQSQCERARSVVAASSLDDLSAREAPFVGRVSLRWVLVHMLEETARHAGHLDLMREQLDGSTGD